MNTVIEIVGRRGLGQDRATISRRDNRLCAVVADGAGGTAGGARAAEHIVACVAATEIRTIEDCADLLIALDKKLEGIGQSTAVIAVTDGNVVWGASAGDSEALLIRPDEVIHLTEHQHKKPLLGSGAAVPVAFGPYFYQGFMVLGSDGLFKYAPIATIEHSIRSTPLSMAGRRLVDLVRLRNKELQDDVSVIVVENSPSCRASG